ncbi:MAG: ATP-dependent DNA helicase RecG [Clostridia bacterium]|nr:ATP-dependent DNA helicase RecG [Clostridia bacterium]
MAIFTKENYISQPLTVLPGIGKVKAQQFSSLGVKTVGDLLYHFPRGYQNRGDICLLGEASMMPMSCATLLTVGSVPTSVRLKGSRIMTRFTAFDDSGKCVITFFNQPYLKDVFLPGAVFRFWGRVEKNGGRFTLTSPDYELSGEGRVLPEFRTVYPTTKGLSQKFISQTVAEALSYADLLCDPLPGSVLREYRLEGFADALRGIHFPQTYKDIDGARRRFIFEELFLFSLGMQKSEKRAPLPPEAVLGKADLKPFIALLPYELTGAQKKTLREIYHDMTGARPMTRLICGDVGSGKTVCAAGAIEIALQNGKQAALMVPTEILANQHFSALAPLFEKRGYKTALLTGALSASEKKKVRAALAGHGVDLVIGTHALLTEDTVFDDLALVIADEQHRFGVNQRSALSGKGEEVHTLVMTATPIPRTLALILYNGLDISYIDELPPGRRSVKTYTVDSGYADRLTAFMRKQASEGHQTYVVCPAVSEEEDDGDPQNDNVVPLSFVPGDKALSPIPMKAAVNFSEELQKALPDLRVGFVHGKMKAKDKDAVMKAFAAGEIQILVSTTVIEVGVNVPNATLMVVENAERFGLAQLHQLRGRVGRGSAQSYCVLVSDASPDSPAARRLKTICMTEKGLEIANEDLKLRGPGDFFPTASGGQTRQSGEFSFRIASFCTDSAMPDQAVRAAKALLEQDPDLKDHPATDARMMKLFSITKNTMN